MLDMVTIESIRIDKTRMQKFMLDMVTIQSIRIDETRMQKLYGTFGFKSFKKKCYIQISFIKLSS